MKINKIETGKQYVLKNNLKAKDFDNLSQFLAYQKIPFDKQVTIMKVLSEEKKVIISGLTGIPNLPSKAIRELYVQTEIEGYKIVDKATISATDKIDIELATDIDILEDNIILVTKTNDKNLIMFFDKNTNKCYCVLRVVSVLRKQYEFMVGISICDSCDDFSLKFGMELAYARAKNEGFNAHDKTNWKLKEFAIMLKNGILKHKNISYSLNDEYFFNAKTGTIMTFSINNSTDCLIIDHYNPKCAVIHSNSLLRTEKVSLNSTKGKRRLPLDIFIEQLNTYCYRIKPKK